MFYELILGWVVVVTPRNLILNPEIEQIFLHTHVWPLYPCVPMDILVSLLVSSRHTISIIYQVVLQNFDSIYIPCTGTLGSQPNPKLKVRGWTYRSSFSDSYSYVWQFTFLQWAKKDYNLVREALKGAILVRKALRVIVKLFLCYLYPVLLWNTLIFQGCRCLCPKRQV